MSLVKDIVSSMAQEGEITHDFDILNKKFVLRALSTEEQLLADSMVDADATNLKKKYGADDLVTYNDTIAKYRSLSLIALSVKTIDGQSPVDEEKSTQEQFKQRLELREELMGLNAFLVGELTKEYNNLRAKQIEFFSNTKEYAEK